MRDSFHNTRVLTLDDIAKVAPSAFATTAHESRSARFRAFPTIETIKKMIAEGFQPVQAKQSRTRVEGRQAFTKHQIRFRHMGLTEKVKTLLGSGTPLALLPEIPELILTNANDGTSSYVIDLGIWRFICGNGMMVQSEKIESLRVRHTGGEDLIGKVIEGSFRVIDEAPKAIEQITAWKHTILTRKEQEAFAAAAKELRDTTLDLTPQALLGVRRFEDQDQDVWTTMNVVQENLIRGGIEGVNGQNKRRTLRSVKGIDSDTKINKALWTLTERMAQLKAA